MKKILKSFALIFIFTLLSFPLYTQDGSPPPPPSQGQNGNQPPGGGAPIGGGLCILLLAGAAYGGRKLFQIKNNEKLQQ
jgi:hypothetical protein